MRSGRKAQRASALLMAGVVAAVGPVLMPLPATAQDAEQPGGYYAEPPPVNRGALRLPNTAPDKPYELDVACVTRDDGLDTNDKLKTTPWGQDYLRIDDVHDWMAREIGHVGRFRDGRPVRVAVIDTGITPHAFLQDRVEPGADYVQENPPGGPGMKDCDGHGTEVAGIIAANTNAEPDLAFNGVAPEAEIISIRQSSQNYKTNDDAAAAQQPGGEGQPGQPGQPGEGEEGQPPEEGNGNEQPADGDQPSALGRDGGTIGPSQGGRTQNEGETAGTLKTLADAVRFAADRNAHVINISINACREADGAITPQQEALQAAVHYAVEEKDAVVVSAAGNVSDRCPQNTDRTPASIVTPPWFADDVLSVAAMDETGSVADFSVHGPWVSVAAPGTQIISLDPAEGSDRLANQTIENGEARFIEGTSFAAPYVAGLAALVRAAHPHLDAREVMHRIKSTAQHPAAPGGRDDFVGYGPIDPMAALTATVPGEQGGPAPTAQLEQIPTDMPPANNPSPVPMIVALAGSAGGLVALLITMFVVHTIRRNRPKAPEAKRI